MENQFSEIMFFLLQALAMRWFIFDYKKLGFFRKLILRGFLAELAICTFCQGFEAGIFIYLINFKSLPLNHFLFTWPLTAGFFALILEPIFQSQIKKIEGEKNFSFTNNHEA